MSPRINYNLHAPDSVKKLLELSQLNSQGSLDRTLIDRLNISSPTTPGSLDAMLELTGSGLK